MKIRLVNLLDERGGAARAASSLNRALSSLGHDSKLIVQQKFSDSAIVSGPETRLDKGMGLLYPVLDNIPLLFYRHRLKVDFSCSSITLPGIVKKINNEHADIVHLNWINGGMLRVQNFKKIIPPKIWTLHDTFGFTGGCHTTDQCLNYQTGCGACPCLGSTKRYDLSRLIFKRRKKLLDALPRMKIVCVSTWLKERCEKSSLFENHDVIHIPNPIDTKSFAPFCQSAARRLFRLPANKKIVLFGAMSALDDPNKGFKFLLEALRSLANDLEVVVFGAALPKNPYPSKQNIRYLGRIDDRTSLRAIYAAADVTVVPSKIESFGLVAAESMACGTPVVAFDKSGIADIIDHKINGYLAKPLDAGDLAKGINYILSQPLSRGLQTAARQKIKTHFNDYDIAKKYCGVYEEVVRSHEINL